MKVNMDAAGKSVEVDAQGGMILKGAAGRRLLRATMTTALPGVPAQDVVMVKRGASLQMRVNGVSRTLTVPASTKPSTTAGFDLNAITPYVKDVSVSTLDVNGRTEDEVTGTLDGDALLTNLPGISKRVARERRRRSVTSRFSCSSRETATSSRRHCSA